MAKCVDMKQVFHQSIDWQVKDIQISLATGIARYKSVQLSEEL